MLGIIQGDIRSLDYSPSLNPIAHVRSGTCSTLATFWQHRLLEMVTANQVRFRCSLIELI